MRWLTGPVHRNVSNPAFKRAENPGIGKEAYAYCPETPSGDIGVSENAEAHQ